MTIDQLAGEVHTVAMDPTELLDTAAVAELLTLEPDTIRMHMYRGTMPKPDHRFGASPVWYRSTIEQWNETRRKNPAAQRKEES